MSHILTFSMGLFGGFIFFAWVAIGEIALREQRAVITTTVAFEPALHALAQRAAICTEVSRQREASRPNTDQLCFFDTEDADTAHSCFDIVAPPTPPAAAPGP